MTLQRLGRWRLPAVALLAVLLALAVVGGILLLGNLPGIADASPSASIATSPSASQRAGDTPESAVRAFFEAFAKARETDDPKLVEPYVNATSSSAYLTVVSFLNGQRQVGKASVVTVNELSNFATSLQGDRATVTFDHRLGGYDVDVKTGQPLETPVVLPVQHKTADVAWVSGSWLVDSFENVQ